MINISSNFIYPIKKTFPDAKVKTKYMYKCYFLILIMDPVFLQIRVLLLNISYILKLL